MKTNTQHTPGPWKHDSQRDQVFASNSSLICKIATGEDTHEENANARLIAAAPALLEALKLFVDGFDAEKDKQIAEMFGPCGGSNEIARNQARAAIAQAEGGNK